MKATLFLLAFLAVVGAAIALKHQPVAKRAAPGKAGDGAESFVQQLRGRQNAILARNRREQLECFPSGGPDCNMGDCTTCCLDCNGGCSPTPC